MDERETYKASGHLDTDFIKAVATLALHQTMANEYGAIKLQNRPVRRMTAEQAAAPGKLVFTAMAKSLAVDDPHHGRPEDKQVQVVVLTEPDSASVNVTKCETTKSYSPHWLVQSSTDESQCNMEVATREIQVSVKVPGKSVKACAVPILRNTKAVAVGDELKVYRPALVREMQKRQRVVMPEDGEEKRQRC